MRRSLFFAILTLFVLSPSWSDMRYEALDAQLRSVRITYEIDDNKAGNKIFIFPTGGFIHDATAGNFEVESVFDIAAKRELEYVIQRDKETGLPQVKITYADPIPPGKSKTLQIAVKVNMPESMLYCDANGRYCFRYETSHKFEFLIPKDHYLVYTNQPVLLFEKGDVIIVQQLDDKFREIVIQTRSMK
ncbi:MAG: hypothetical protein JXR73_03110 [Candidatus Omnitrophica bacterium]|nr:hypothetical protein [Candidatus Omnitrophota bacterium]